MVLTFSEIFKFSETTFIDLPGKSGTGASENAKYFTCIKPDVKPAIKTLSTRLLKPLVRLRHCRVVVLYFLNQWVCALVNGYQGW